MSALPGQKSYALSDIHQVAADLVAAFPYDTVWLLEGEMGSGKSTLARAMLEVLGFADVQGSPTYGIATEYESGSRKAVHLDLYRLKRLEEALDAGLEDYLGRGYALFIEWPEIALPLLKSEDPVFLKITREGNDQRLIECYE